MAAYTVVLTELRCIEETSGGGSDEIAFFFSAAGTNSSLVREDVCSGLVISGPALFPLVSGGANILNNPASPGINGIILGASRDSINLRAFGLEIDGSSSTVSQARDYLTDFSGSDDFGTGNDDILFDHRWSISAEELDEVTNTSKLNMINDNQGLVGRDIETGGRFVEDEGPFSANSMFNFAEHNNEGGNLVYRVAQQTLDLFSEEQCSHYQLRIAYFDGDAAFQP